MQWVEDPWSKEGHEWASTSEPGLGVFCPDLTAENLLLLNREQSWAWQLAPVLPALRRW